MVVCGYFLSVKVLVECLQYLMSRTQSGHEISNENITGGEVARLGLLA